WAVGLTSLGYFLGNTIPGVDKYLLPLVGFIVIASLLPSLWKVTFNRNHRERMKTSIKEALERRK
ncbi:MAG: DedA family protein, partial [Candidatus Veblenbacteria bacterium]|nr:DedA family protein [Candidatus Veblenbacteria bacterium]